MTSHRTESLPVVLVVAAGVCLVSKGWVLQSDHIGPARIGMSLSQLNTLLHEAFVAPKSKKDQACFYVTSAQHPQVSFMIEGGLLVRIDVDGPGVSNGQGIQVGDSEEKALKAYGAALKVKPHAYTGPEGHYLTVKSNDGRFGTRFETEKGKVKSFYAGSLKAIQYVEGCQ